MPRFYPSEYRRRVIDLQDGSSPVITPGGLTQPVTRLCSKPKVRYPHLYRPYSPHTYEHRLSYVSGDFRWHSSWIENLIASDDFLRAPLF